MNMLKTIILVIAAALFATPNLQAKYLDDETDLIYYGYRYYNPSTGRWLSRDPIGIRGGKNLFCFLRNDSINKWDKLGKQCCLTTISPGTFSGPNGEDNSKLGHSILKCDNGAYVSFWPSDDPNGYHSWDESQDDQVYSGATKTTTCFSCLDEGKVQQWLDANKGTVVWSASYNCSDAVNDAVISGLSADQQKKPTCPCDSAGLFGRLTWNVKDLLDHSGFNLPTDTAADIAALVANNCQRFKCVSHDVSGGMGPK